MIRFTKRYNLGKLFPNNCNLMKQKKKKQKIKFRKIAVVVVLSQVFLYTWAHLILSAFVGIEIAPTTSVAFYAFCGAEAGLLAWIKNSDKEEKNEKQEKPEEEEKPYERDFSSENGES